MGTKASSEQAGALVAPSNSSLINLQVLHGVPVVLEEDDRVGPREVQPQAPHVGGQEEHVYGRVTVEPAGEEKEEGET